MSNIAAVGATDVAAFLTTGRATYMPAFWSTVDATDDFTYLAAE